jgi:hypothetical protein
MSDSGVELDPQGRDNESTDSLDLEQLHRCTEHNRRYPNTEYWLATIPCWMNSTNFFVIGYRPMTRSDAEKNANMTCERISGFVAMIIADRFSRRFYQCFGDCLYHCPMDNPQQALDLGTGGGNWAIDFAE